MTKKMEQAIIPTQDIQEKIRGELKQAIHESWHDASSINSVIDKSVHNLSTLLSQELAERGNEWAAFIRSKVDRHYLYSKGSTGIHVVHEYDLEARLKEI